MVSIRCRCEIAERAVVGQHVEAVVDSLERSSRLMPAVVAIADVRAQEWRPFVAAQLAHALEQLVLGEVLCG